MTKNEFDFQMIRLEGTYGKRKYPGERKAIFWEKFQDIDGKTFSSAVSNLIADSERAPMAKDLMAILRQIIQRNTVEKKMADEMGRCKTCYDLGTVYVGRWEGNGFTNDFRRCHCALGNNHNHLDDCPKNFVKKGVLLPTLFRRT